MKKSKLLFKTADEVEAVFYEAFMHCDAQVIAALWADEGALCVHPGSGVISGYDAVVRSWESILGNSRRTEMRYTPISRAAVDDLAAHVVAEEMLESGAISAVVVATNVYRRCDPGWLMIEHHASLVQNRGSGQTLQ